MMPEIVKNPLMSFFDEEFIAYAGMEIMSQTIIAFVAIMCALRFFDMLTDSTTRPARSRMLTRGLLAFTIPFVIVFASTYANTLPSAYRTYGEGTYEAGKTLPAGAYSLYADSGASVTIEGADGEVSHQWASGTLGATIYEGDRITLEGCVAKNRTAGLAYSSGAPTKCVANGTACLVGGSDLKPGTYELKSLGGDSCYEVRRGYLESGSPINGERFDGIAYADVHFGDVLYLSGASATLYSNVFSLSRPDADAAGAEGDEGKDADGKDGKKDEATDDKADETGKGTDRADGKADGGQGNVAKEDAPDASPADGHATGAGEAGKGADATRSTQVPAVTDAETIPSASGIPAEGSPADKTSIPAIHDDGTKTKGDVTGDGKVDAEDLIRQISVLPFPQSYYSPKGAGAVSPLASDKAEGTDASTQADDGRSGEPAKWSFGDAIRGIAEKSSRASV